MTSLFMGNVVATGVPADEKVVRNTATPVDINAPAAMQEDMPETQEFSSDPNPDLGMVNRQLASTWIEGSAADYSVIASRAAEQGKSNQSVNDRIATSGTAAGRELSGETHKNLSFAVGIEPVHDLADPAHKMSNTYFTRNERNVQEGMGDYMTSAPGYDHQVTGKVAAGGKKSARDAAVAALYADFWNGGN